MRSAIDLTVAEALIAPVSQIRPATYLGKGKVEEIVGLITGHEIELVVMDCALSPIQQRNLEKAWNTKVLDRTGLILEIFGRRAKTKEGALQVELAHLNYQRCAWCGRGPIWSASAAASGSWAAPAKPRSRPIAA